MKPFAKIRKNYYMKLIFAFSIFAVILIGLIGGILYTKANNVMLNEIFKDNQYNMENIMNYVENTFLKKYEDAFMNKIIVSINPNSLNDINFFLNYPPTGNEYRLASLAKELNTVTMVNTGTESVNIYYRKWNFVIDHGSYLEDTNNSTDKDFLNKIDSNKTNKWIIREYKTGKKEYKTVLTYIYPLDYAIQKQKPDGYMYINIDVQYLENMLKNMMNLRKTSVYIFDDKGNLILRTHDTDDIEMHNVKNLSSSTKKDSAFVSDKNGKKVYSYLPSSNSNIGWNYAIVRPYASFLLSSEKLKNEIIIVCFMVVLLGFLFSYIISKRFYLPMRRIMNNIRNLAVTSVPSYNENEYAVIDNTILTMNNKINILKDRAEDIQIKNIISGNLAEVEEFPLFPVNPVFVAIQIKIIKNQQNHSFKEKFQQNKHYIDYKLACIDYEEILILYYGDEDIPDIIDLIHKDLEYFKSITHDVFKFGGGIGSAVSKLENVYESYRHAQLALKYRFLHGTDSLISFKDISNRSKLLVGIEFDSFKNLLKSSDINAISRFFNNFKASVNGKQIQIESVELMLMQTVLSMSKVIIDMNLHNSVISSTELATQFKKETFEETINGLLNIAIQIANYINNTSSSYYTGIVSKLKDYIDKHLSEDISLNVLAQVVSLSPSYVSTLFSEVLHMSFLDYLTNMRLEIASQLLRTEFISVSDIATKVGYRNSKYFCTKFKEKYGVTPMQYRGQ